MTRAYISTTLRQMIRERAEARCEYCLYPEEMSFLAFEVEHVIAEKHEHFQLVGAQIIPHTPEGRVTVAILQLNHPDRVRERQRLIEIGKYPR